MREKIAAAMKESLKAGDKTRLGAVRLIQAALKDKDIEARGLGRGQATPEELLGLLQKMIKQRQESFEIFEKNNRPELAAQEKAEIDVISSFLPAQMTDSDVKMAIAAAISETGAASVKDMGKVIGVLKAKFSGQMDFGKASGLVKAALAG